MSSSQKFPLHPFTVSIPHLEVTSTLTSMTCYFASSWTWCGWNNTGWAFCASFHSLYVHKIHLCCCVYHYLILLSCCVIFYCMDIHSVLSIVLSMDIWGFGYNGKGYDEHSFVWCMRSFLFIIDLEMEFLDHGVFLFSKYSPNWISLLKKVKMLVTQSCSTLCDPHGPLPARPLHPWNSQFILMCKTALEQHGNLSRWRDGS